jgi:dTDP-4-amino-4,6-dideoxygalactose transaminase
MGDLACFSFYPAKNLGACGEGGMVVTNNPEYTRTIRLLRDWGAEHKYHHSLKGYNYRLEGMQGAILRVKLRHLDQWTESRRANAARYSQLLAGSGVVPPAEMPYARHVYHAYTVRTSCRAELQDRLQSAGVQTGVYYAIPIHLQPAHADLHYRAGDFPVAEQAAREVISLPIYPELSAEQIAQVVDVMVRAAPSA